MSNHVNNHAPTAGHETPPAAQQAMGLEHTSNLAELARRAFGAKSRVSKLCAACPARGAALAARDGKAERRLRRPTTRGHQVAAIELNREFVLTVELVIKNSRTDCRLQLNTKNGGALRALPFRVTFAATYLARVLEALVDAQRILSSAVPIAPDPAPIIVEAGSRGDCLPNTEVK